MNERARRCLWHGDTIATHHHPLEGLAGYDRRNALKPCGEASAMKLSRAAELAADDPVEFVGPERDVVSWPSLGEMGIVVRSEDRGIRVLWERSTMMMAWPREWVRLARAEPEESSPRSSND